jgi:hypothetical protein
MAKVEIVNVANKGREKKFLETSNPLGLINPGFSTF